MFRNITIIGSGSWATALVKIFSESGIHISWVVRDAALAAQIQECARNTRYLSYVDLNLDFVNPTVDLEKAIHSSEMVIFALPSAYLSQAAEAIDPAWIVKKQVVVSIKGFVPGTAMVPSIFIQKKFGLLKPVMVIGGPCHAEEIAIKRNTYVTIAGTDTTNAERLKNSIQVKYVNGIVNNDPSGVEYVAILKNIIGIATGIAAGLNYGENFIAVLVSNAMREVNRFLRSVNLLYRDVFDSAYFGDMLVTAYSDLSRNRTLGKLIGRGIKVSQALQAMEMVAEGYRASEELYVLTKNSELHLPIITSVYRILHQHASAFHEFKLIEKQLR